MASTASIEVSDAGSSAQHVRACQTCAISKAKCAPRPASENGKCERCNRLKKRCLPGQHTQRKPRRSRTNRTAQLEERLEGLVSLLTSAQTSASGLSLDSDARHVLPHKPTNEPLTPQSIDPYARSRINVAAPNIRPNSSQSQYPSSLIRNDPLPSSVGELSADNHLAAFRNNMASYFPFIAIPTNITADELHASKPFLYQNIMMVTSYPKVSRQLSLRSGVIQSLIEQTFLQGKKSLNLLQGILVFAAWYHQSLGPSPQMTNMIQLATALVFDLSLHKTQSPVDGPHIYTEAMKSFNDRRIKPPRTLEERRAFLGLFCLSRGLSSSFGKIEPLQNTPYVEECCVEIEKQQEYLSDRYLVFQVRLQIVADATVRSFPFHGVDYWSKLGTEPICMLVKSFQRDLERFKNTVEPELAQSTLFQIHFLSTSMHNTEIALRKTLTTDITQPVSDPARVALLMTCLQSTKAFFTEWLSLPSSVYHHLPINVFALVAHAASVLGMLNLFQHDGWDLDYVREIAPFSLTMDKLAQKYEEASREVDNGAISGCSLFWRGGMKMQKLLDWYEARLKGPIRQEELENGNLETMFDATTQDMATGLDMDILDEGFWNEMMGWTAYDQVM